MSNLQIFNNQEFGQVRVLEKDGQPWFVAKDVARILGYSNTRDAISKHVDNEDKGVANCDTLGGKQDMVSINESGLYSLILSSKLPNAKKFKRWVTSEVLPCIRKHGMYAKDELLDNPDLLLDVITKLKEEKERSKLLNTENELLSQQVLTWADRKLIEALVKKCGGKIGYEQAWREFKKELLYAHSINLNLRITNYMNESGKKTKPKTLDMIHDVELAACISTAVALCRSKGVNIDDILKKYEEAV